MVPTERSVQVTEPCLDLRELDPRAPELADLINRHLTLMLASSPACSVHAMDANRLAEAGVRFFALFEGEQAVAMGALKRIDASHGEIKSMHVTEGARGRGLAGTILSHLLATARDMDLTRVSLETGSQDAFAPARAFYHREGFAVCPPFEGYSEDPNSTFMTRAV